MDQINIRRVNPESPEALELTGLLFDELEEIYGKGKIEEFTSENKYFLTFVLISYNGNIAGCGALKKFDSITAEIKRMYIKKNYRGKGLSKLILKELERLSSEKGFSRVVLETGVRQPEAVNLYKSSGYLFLTPYGKYADDPESLCFQKFITSVPSKL